MARRDEARAHCASASSAEKAAGTATVSAPTASISAPLHVHQLALEYDAAGCDTASARTHINADAFIRIAARPAQLVGLAGDILSGLLHRLS